MGIRRKTQFTIKTENNIILYKFTNYQTIMMKNNVYKETKKLYIDINRKWFWI